VKLLKKLVNEAPRRDFGEHLVAEGAGIVACVGDADFEEGVRAFMEKRSPQFPSAQ
jgi:2-(1,2-epoxy-1,2-dihydrophenyl)acetyl-CoA isomerase